MDNQYYFDTSAVVPLYSYEIAHTEKIKKFTNSLKNPPLISSLTIVELHAALSKKIRVNELGLDEAKKIAKLFSEHLKKGVYKKIGVHTKHYTHANKWLKEFNHEFNLRTLDALHLSIAAKNSYKLITFDIRLEESADFFKVKCNECF